MKRIPLPTESINTSAFKGTKVELIKLGWGDEIEDPEACRYYFKKPSDNNWFLTSGKPECHKEFYYVKVGSMEEMKSNDSKFKESFLPPSLYAPRQQSGGRKKYEMIKQEVDRLEAIQKQLEKEKGTKEAKELQKALSGVMKLRTANYEKKEA